MLGTALTGTVRTLRRYPVKSMLGEDVPTADVTAAGLAGDRALALIHLTTGHVVSAKNPRLWRAMLTLTARQADGATQITFPDGKMVLSTDADIDERLSDFLGQPVTLTAIPPEDAAMEHADPDEVIDNGVTAEAQTTMVRISAGAPDGTFFNFAPVHLITTATLDRIAELNQGDPVHEHRYRPNVVISTPPQTAGFTENDWLGRDLKIGPGLVLRIVARTPRCAVPTLAHGDTIPRDPAPLRIVARHNRVMPRISSTAAEPCAGVYAQVVTPGRISVSDRLSLVLFLS